MDQLMNNPQAMAMAQAMQNDPELMALMMKPGFMEKLQNLMANPAGAAALASDPDMQLILQKMQSLGLGGGGGGVPGFPGGFGSNSASPPAAEENDDVVHIRDSGAFNYKIKNSEKPVIVDFTASWCGPCKRIAPIFKDLATEYKDRGVFLKVDVDECKGVAMQQGVSSMPTFQFYVGGQKVEEFKGANVDLLKRTVASLCVEQKKVKACPYRHFPLKDDEQVSYKSIKWDAVRAAIDKYTPDLKATSPDKVFTSEDEKVYASLIADLQDKYSYHNKEFSSNTYMLLKKMASWPVNTRSPFLNLLRVMVFHPHAAKTFANEIAQDVDGNLVQTLLKISDEAEKPTACLLSFRTLTNAFGRRILAKQIVASHGPILESILEIADRHDDKNLYLSCVGLLINFAIICREDSKEYEDVKVVCLSSLTSLLNATDNPKYVYRALVVVGTLIYRDIDATGLANDLMIPSLIEEIQQSNQDPKVQEVCTEVLAALNDPEA